ncbi:DUF2523 domain-containing protein [Halomonas sp. HL-93]|uniref:DUF2523 domain-containing protein n=1 Tax=Halomonas sp. HL-93 TaxID=1666906 RepID=UPI0007F1074B|nr:DUF2523 domain-containing protein [Halomonas sp. HL-93]SBR45137.1 hypothetical protein GA0071314_0090 [Halomonas sp. HL-93]
MPLFLIIPLVVAGSSGLLFLVDYFIPGTVYSLAYTVTSTMLDFVQYLLSFIDSDVLMTYTVHNLLLQVPEPILQAFNAMGLPTAFKIILTAYLIKIALRIIGSFIPFFKFN